LKTSADAPSSLGQLLTPQTVRLRVSAADRMEVVQQAGAMLIASGGVDERYVEAMKHVLVSLGPYMVIVPGVALLHARPEDGARRLCMSLLTLEPPVPFGNPDNDPVTIAFALAAADNESHIKALAELAALLANESAMATIRIATSIEDVLTAVRSAAAGQEAVVQP
jgi:mannitol/fructose-specific phosphotransferase system IIA component (Ntr-type)